MGRVVVKVRAVDAIEAADNEQDRRYLDALLKVSAIVTLGGPFSWDCHGIW
jgi:hypothetical protein